MSVTVQIESIFFRDESPRMLPDDPPPERYATVVVLVGGVGSEPLKLQFSNRRFESLDSLAEGVRQEVRRFADDLAKAADLPLR